MEYTALPVREDELVDMIDRVRSVPFRGISVTMPHKHAVMTLLDELTPAANELRAVNHITNDDGHLTGNNTDGGGFVAGLARGHGVELEGTRVAVLGAGGAARAIVWACGREASDVAVIARNQASADSAASAAAGVARRGTVDDLHDADIVVNATPVGMAGSPYADSMPLDVGVLRTDAIVVDIVYTPLQTPLLAAASARGLRVIDGLAMLAGQAAEQFTAWTGIEAPLDVMLEAARREPGEQKASIP